MTKLKPLLDKYSVADIARRMRVTHRAVRQWRDGEVPAERAVELEKLFPGEITREQLRPDLFLR